MARGQFTQDEMNILASSPYIASVEPLRVLYTYEFKCLFIREWLAGKKPTQIFKDAGLDPKIFGDKRIERASARWRELYSNGGFSALNHRKVVAKISKANTAKLERQKSKLATVKERSNTTITELKEAKRVIRSTNKAKIQSIEEEKQIKLAREYAKHIEQLEKLKKDMEQKLRVQEEKLASVKLENEILKKGLLNEGRRCRKKALGRIEMCRLIKETIDAHPEISCLKSICKAVGIPRSSYYYYLSSIENRKVKEDSDLEKLFFIQKAYNNIPYKRKGSRSLKLELKNNYELIYNRKCIQRIMRKYNIHCPIKSNNPYKNIWKATKEDRVVPNILKRNFKPGQARKVFLTDITYIKHQGKFSYLSVIIDSQTTEPVAFKLSQSLKENFVLDTLKQLHKEEFAKDALIHSDQGVHYTSYLFHKAVKDMGLIQSMSRRGNCLDNASCESFFGHLKTEMDINENSSFDELETAISKYIYYYRYQRYQQNLDSMTPYEYGTTLLKAS